MHNGSGRSWISHPLKNVFVVNWYNRCSVCQFQKRKDFVDVTKIMKITESVVTNLANVNLAQKVIMNRKYENQVNGLIRRFTQISKTPQFQGLVGTHSFWTFVVLSFTFNFECRPFQVSKTARNPHLHALFDPLFRFTCKTYALELIKLG